MKEKDSKLHVNVTGSGAPIEVEATTMIAFLLKTVEDERILFQPMVTGKRIEPYTMTSLIRESFKCMIAEGMLFDELDWAFICQELSEFFNEKEEEQLALTKKNIEDKKLPNVLTRYLER